MIKAFAVYKKDVMSLFFSPVAYITVALFMFLVSLMGAGNMYQASMRDVFGYMSLFMIFVIPMATMRVFSEEMRQGTIELLMTSPAPLWALVIGKFAAVMTLIAAIFALSGEFVIFIAKYGKPDWGPMVSGYIGLLLLSSAFVSIGVFSSSLTKNQFISAVICFVVMLFFMVINTLSEFFGPGAASEVLNQLAIFTHFYDFDKGLITLSNVVYYIGFTFLFLFLTVRNLEMRRW